MAVPNLSRYFLAEQLVYLHRWLILLDNDEAVSLEAAVVDSNEALSHLGTRAPCPLTISMQAKIQA